MFRLTSLFQNTEEVFPCRIIFLILSGFLFRLVPALLFFGSPEITRYSIETTPSPLLPLFRLLSPLRELTGTPLVFRLKFPGIMADVGITCMVYFMAYQVLQDRRRAFVLGLFYALNPLSILVVSSGNNTVSISLALVLASFFFSRIAPNLILSSILYGTALAVDDLCILFFPILLLKAGNRWATRAIFTSFSLATLAAWALPPFLKGRAILSAFRTGPPGEALAGIYGPLKFLENQGISEPFKNYLAFSHSLLFFLKDNGALCLAAGLTVTALFHKRYNFFFLCALAPAGAFLTLPGLRPYYLLWLLPFFLLSSSRTANVLSPAASVFLVCQYSLVPAEAGTLCTSRFLYRALTNAHLHEQEWLYWTFVVSGAVILGILSFSLINLVLLAPGAVDHLKEKPISPKNASLICVVAGIWITSGALLSLGVLPAGTRPGSFSHRPGIQPPVSGRYGETFYYRNLFRMTSEGESIILNVSAEDFLNIFLNGNRMFSGCQDPPRRGVSGKNRGVSVALTPYLRKGENILGIESHHVSTRPFPGLAVSLLMKDKKRGSFSLPFLKGWRANDRRPYTGWTLPGFDDSGWAPPVVLKGLPAGEKRRSREFFYMLPRRYTPPASPVCAPLLFMIYSLGASVLFFRIEKRFHFPYAFFSAGAK